MDVDEALARALVEDHQIRFLVERHRSIVRVHASHRHPAAVDHERLRMHHRRLVLEDSHATLEQFVVTRASRVPRALHIGILACRKNANVDSALHCIAQELSECFVGNEVRVRDVKALSRSGDRQYKESLGGCAADCRRCMENRREHSIL